MHASLAKWDQLRLLITLKSVLSPRSMPTGSLCPLIGCIDELLISDGRKEKINTIAPLNEVL